MVARGLDQDRFEITMAEKTDHGDVEILYTARYEGKSYGYIRYSGTENGGVIDITNRDAQLKIQDLDFGPSGKEMNESQAGRHGEGMKIALVVFMRRPLSHFVTFHASGCKWNFSWRQVSKKLGVKITRMNTVPLQKLVGKSEADFSKGLVPFVVDHSRDVQVQIGVGLRRKDELGRLMRSTPLVSVDNFHEWCQAASWLQPMNDADVVKTDVGSLFLNNSKLCQKFFLRGLLLSEPDSQGNTASLTSKPLKYGYDFRDGYVNRERKNFSRWTEESAKILDIWCEVIRIKPELVKSFCDMLLNSTKYADVHGVQSFLDHIMVNRIWKELRSRQCWYYNQAQKDKVSAASLNSSEAFLLHRELTFMNNFIGSSTRRHISQFGLSRLRATHAHLGATRQIH